MSGRLHEILVATPLGEGGNGGIDRLMDAVRTELADHVRDGVFVRFAVTRGQGSIVFAPWALVRVLTIIATRRPDLVHINLSSFGSTYRKLAVAGCCRLFGVPYVLHLHGSIYRRFWDNSSPLLARAITTMFARAARVLVLGTVWRDYVTARVPSAHVEIVPNAAAASSVSHVPAEHARVLFLGRVGARKGVFDLIGALGRLPTVPPWRAILAGDGEIERAREAVAGENIDDRVTVQGWASPAEVARLIAESDILVLPSYDENLPMSVIEGMAAGLAVVATPVGAVEDIILDGETGLLVPPGDVDALADALSQLIVDPALRSRLGTAGQVLHRARLDLVPYVNRLIAIWLEAAR
jgi:glycosyltransferase involved in cell wall biosynthesis